MASTLPDLIVNTLRKDDEITDEVVRTTVRP